MTHLRPKHSNVILHDGGEVTVPIIDAKSMIMDLLTNQKCMNKSNIAKGYDVFTGDVDKSEKLKNGTEKFTLVMLGFQQETDFAFLSMMKILMTCLLN